MKRRYARLCGIEKQIVANRTETVFKELEDVFYVSQKRHKKLDEKCDHFISVAEHTLLNYCFAYMERNVKFQQSLKQLTSKVQKRTKQAAMQYWEEALKHRSYLRCTYKALAL